MEDMMEELGECELGCQEFWNKRYQVEVKNFRSHGDVGEIWFGEDIVCRILKWLNKNVEKSKKIIDLGCGNGMLCIELFNEGYKNLQGYDYSETAIQLAKEIAEKEKCDIPYKILDILSDNPDISDADILLDKGTYDAISLSADAKINRNKYIENVYNFLKNDGALVITSCNWTQEELSEQFAEKFMFFDLIPTPTFKFGGKVGSIVSSVVFKKRII